MVLTGLMKNNKLSKPFGLSLLGIIFYVVCFSLTACSDIGCDKKTTHPTEVVQEKKIPSPVFNADSSYQYVKDQVDFGPRVPNSLPHQKCGDYLIQSLQKFGLVVKVQNFEAKAFDGKLLKLRNIIASVNPDASQRILLAAHWDTRPFADQDSINKNKPINGANDGGSGVGILLEIARSISSFKTKPDVGVDIILFDGEDYGATEDFEGDHTDTYCLGSQYWAKNKGSYSAFFGILLDMAGAKNARFAMEGGSMQYAPTVTNIVWNTAHSIGVGEYFIYKKTSQITDDHYYINTIAQIPCIDIIEYNMKGDGYFGDYWHTHNDNMEVIDPKTLKAVGQTLLEVVYNQYKKLL
jgi:glutaminyl-peptide cyclotransferase